MVAYDKVTILKIGGAPNSLYVSFGGYFENLKKWPP